MQPTATPGSPSERTFPNIGSNFFLYNLPWAPNNRVTFDRTYGEDVWARVSRVWTNIDNEVALFPTYHNKNQASVSLSARLC